MTNIHTRKIIIGIFDKPHRQLYFVTFIRLEPLLSLFQCLLVSFQAFLQTIRRVAIFWGHKGTSKLQFHFNMRFILLTVRHTALSIYAHFYQRNKHMCVRTYMYEYMYVIMVQSCAFAVWRTAARILTMGAMEGNANSRHIGTKTCI